MILAGRQSPQVLNGTLFESSIQQKVDDLVALAGKLV